MPTTTALLLALGLAQAAPPDNPDEALKQAGPGEAVNEPLTESSASLAQAWATLQGTKFFPSTPPKLMPYLDEANIYGSECLKKDALFTGDPLSAAAQQLKTALAQVGFTYSLWQAYDFTAMSDVRKGTDNVLNYYNALFFGTWNIFQSSELTGTAGWLVIGANAGVGLGYDANRQSPQNNMGTLAYTMGTEYGDQVYLYELAWQQSFFNGHLVVTAGFLDQEYALDLNTYSNNAYNQLMNYEFINAAVLPWSYQSLGVIVQWQPCDSFYCMWGSAANDTQPRQDVFDVSSNNWSNTFEFGYIDPNFLGMGRGVYRVLPFVATVDGTTGAGVVFNVEQQLWKDGPIGLFARAGFGNPKVTTIQGAQASFGGGIAIAGSTDNPLMKSEQSYFAAGFYWLDPADQTLARQNEFGIELTYVVQLTETLTVQPDIQFIFDPVQNMDADMNTQFTLQFNITW
ncbi:MAG: carbohydrate porin [Phycisphaerales bacterium]